MDKEDLKVGRKYLVVRTDDHMQTGSVVECIEVRPRSGHYDARYKVRLADIRETQKEFGNYHRTPSGSVSKTFKEFWLQTNHLEPHDDQKKTTSVVKRELTVGMKLKVTKENSWVKIGSVVEVHTIDGLPARRDTPCSTDEIYVLVNKSDQTKVTGFGYKHGDRKGYYIYLKCLSEMPSTEKKEPTTVETKRKIGDKFRVIKENQFVKVGEIVVLAKDDGSQCPQFKVKKESTHYSGASYLWLTMNTLEPYTPKVEDPYKDVKEAHAKGAKIEWRPGECHGAPRPDDSWMDAVTPAWVRGFEYRIKPEDVQSKDPHKELKEAFAKGTEIESFDPHSGTWFSASTPKWHSTRKYRIKFEEGDLCYYIGSTSTAILTNSCVRYIREYGIDSAIVQSGLIQVAVRHDELHRDELKPREPVGGYLRDELTVFAGKPSPSASAYFEVQVAKQAATPCSTQPNPHQEETPMKFENKYFLNGREITDFSDMQIFSIIKDAEDAIEKLEQIATKPKSLQQNIADRKAELAKLVEFLDSREPKTEA